MGLSCDMRIFHEDLSLFCSVWNLSFPIRDRTHVPYVSGWILSTDRQGSPPEFFWITLRKLLPGTQCAFGSHFYCDFHGCAQLLQSCLTPYDSVDCSLPGSSVHGILQAKILAWGTISFSKESSRPRNWTHISCIAGRFFTNSATWEATFMGYMWVFWLILDYSVGIIMEG